MRKSILILCVLVTAVIVFGQTPHKRQHGNQSGVVSGRTAAAKKPSTKPKPKASPKPSTAWQFVDSGGGNNTYYQPASVRFLDSTTVRVWTKTVPIDLNAARKQKADAETDEEKSTRYLTTYAHTKMLFDVRCRTRESRVRQVVDYADDGSVLDNVDDTAGDVPWSTIVANSLMDVLRLKICPK